MKNRMIQEVLNSFSLCGNTEDMNRFIENLKEVREVMDDIILKNDTSTSEDNQNETNKTLSEDELRELRFQQRQTRFTSFTKDLATISKKHGVSLNICGGVSVYNNNDLKDLVSIEYDNDSSSGDLRSYVEWKED